MIRHQACQWTRQEDPQQQPTHDVADHPATLALRRQMRRQRYQHLHRHRTEADQQCVQQEHLALPMAAGAGQQQATGGQHRRGDHQPAVLQQAWDRRLGNGEGGIHSRVPRLAKGCARRVTDIRPGENPSPAQQAFARHATPQSASSPSQKATNAITRREPR
ncbi:hypothetical protein WR25_18403 [Diploscapter pachys]|uniref:Uncharacterized protein n=1 Tax=Diploscapter pachys TaxID=2018661 RepID=A0A2A2K4F1_9BILA|nr:hypothetical protein WR25_18403 [Diploscapter pachys]